jgi:hypothetical protein
MLLEDAHLADGPFAYWKEEKPPILKMVFKRCFHGRGSG